MYTNEIDSALKKAHETNQIYLGTFAINQLPDRKIERFPSCLIVNTCPARIKNGSTCHWVAIYIDKNKVEYFDTSGLPTFLGNHQLTRFLEKQQKKISFNYKQIQAFNSIKCGQFSCIFVFGKSIRYPMKKIIKLFHKKDLEKNDEIVQHIFDCIFTKGSGKKCISDLK
jgi:hypothetical protein